MKTKPAVPKNQHLIKDGEPRTARMMIRLTEVDKAMVDRVAKAYKEIHEKTSTTDLVNEALRAHFGKLEKKLKM